MAFVSLLWSFIYLAVQQFFSALIIWLQKKEVISKFLISAKLKKQESLILLHKFLMHLCEQGRSGHAIAQAASRWFPTAAARVRAWVWSCGIWGGQSGAGAGFLRVLRFPLPIFIPPIAPQSPSSIIWGLYCTIGQKWPHYLVDLVPPH
jgi:hypothetical protein